MFRIIFVFIFDHLYLNVNENLKPLVYCNEK
jgi:hypothetical protein